VHGREQREGGPGTEEPDQQDRPAADPVGDPAAEEQRHDAARGTRGRAVDNCRRPDRRPGTLARRRYPGAPMQTQPTVQPTVPPADDDDDERGDVPGWVLVTMMTAGLVVLLWGVAGPALTGLFDQAISSVSGL
jgi:hypothetical protein